MAALGAAEALMSASLLCSIVAGIVAIMLGTWPIIAMPISRQHKTAFAASGVLGLCAVIQSERLHDESDRLHDRSDAENARRLASISTGVRQLLKARGMDASGDTTTLLNRLRRALPLMVETLWSNQLLSSKMQVGMQTLLKQG